MLALYTPAAGKPGAVPRKASPDSKSPSKKGYSVQVASLRFPDDAEEIVRRRYALLFSFIDAAKRSSGDAA